MSLFAITFRIEHDSGYQSRYESVVEAIQKARSSGPYWSEPTSFFLIMFDGNSEQLAKKIDLTSTFSPSKDLLLVINLSQKGYTPLGQVKDGDLHVLMAQR